MVDLGKRQTLEIKRLTSVGAFMNVPHEETAKEDDILLPKKMVPKGAKVGDELEVFVLRDSSDRLLASTVFPKAEVGELAVMQVIDITKIGAFLDWGLEKDLFLPHDEMTRKPKLYEYYLVGVYLDKSNRLAATMKVKPFFKEHPPYKENDWVNGVVYSVHPEIGAFVLVEGKYDALIPNREQRGAHRPGEEIRARVTNVKPDGKIDLSTQNRAYEELDRDAQTIEDLLRDNEGFLRVNDKTKPGIIRSVFSMSKSQFKRAVGRLLKQGRVQFYEDGIKLKGGKYDNR